MGPEVIHSAARMQPGTRIKCKGMVFQGGRGCVGGKCEGRGAGRGLGLRVCMSVCVVRREGFKVGANS